MAAERPFEDISTGQHSGPDKIPAAEVTSSGTDGPTPADDFGWMLLAISFVGGLLVTPVISAPSRPPKGPPVGTYAVWLALGIVGAAVLVVPRISTEEGRRRLRASKRFPDVLILASPCLFGTVTIAVMLAAIIFARADRNPAVRDALFYGLFWVHSTLAAVASGAAGLLVRGSAAARIATVIGGIVLGFAGHALWLLSAAQATHLIPW